MPTRDTTAQAARDPGFDRGARAISLALILFLFWYVLSGRYELFLLAAGACSAAGVTFMAGRMAVADREGHPIHFVRAVLWYWPWLIKEIFKSGLTVTRLILSPSLPIEPTLVRFRPSQRTATGLCTHANSITLTPGTITVTTEGGEFLVHGLTSASARACIDSEMDQRIRALEGRHK